MNSKADVIISQCPHTGSSYGVELMPQILIGPAGSGGSEIKNFEKIKDAGLDAVELAFTYGVWLKKDKAEEIKSANKRLGLRLSIHAPYYINLNSEDEEKVAASKSRILSSCEIGHHLGAEEVVFHAGFYQKKPPEETYETILREMRDLQKKINREGWKILLSPETTGKPSQFGSFEELAELRQSAGCGITVDFAHIRARNNGIIDYPALMKKLQKQTPFHSHFSGIEYTGKGERRHLLTETEDIEELLGHLLKNRLSTTIINESPSPLEDSLKMKKILEKLKSKK